MTKLLACVALVCGAILLASQVAPASSPPAGASGSTARVDINGLKFQPFTLRIRRGTKVVFSNASSVAHTATRRGSFDTGRIPPGGRAAIRLTRSGALTYICRLHPFMRGKIVVR